MPTVRRISCSASHPLNILQRQVGFGLSPEASTTTELLTGAEQARLRQRFQMRLSLAACSLLGAAYGGWALYREVETGASALIIAGFAIFALFCIHSMSGLLGPCRLAYADYQAGIKHVIRGPLLATDRISGARRRWLPRFRWLIGDRLIGIDVNWDFVYIRGLGGRRLSPADCEAMQHPGVMLEAHVTVASGMALYVASAA